MSIKKLIKKSENLINHKNISHGKRNKILMNVAIEIAKIGIEKSCGGPFGAIIVKNNKIIGWGYNTVLKDNDSTAHGEINAIRNACKNIKSYDLKNCILYTTGEPCPMCLAASIWANISKIYYACNSKMISDIGFRDTKIYEKLKIIKLTDKYLEQTCNYEGKKLFQHYVSIKHKIY